MNEAFEIVVGLETHAELNTKTKIFCGCPNVFGAPPNPCCCPVCTGMPGALPTLNKAVVDSAIKMGHACACTIHNVCKLDRKNYFYPDLPKAYQISQYDVPICESGHLDLLLDEGRRTKRVGITRIHIEEDAGKLLHDAAAGGTMIDYNRCGVPLIEIVSEPDLRSSAEAKAYLDTIKLVLQYLGISDCKMQEGSLRCDVNVSLRPAGTETLGTRVEMKNVNSFSAVVRAIDYEAARQRAILSQGGVIRQETRRWDDVKGESTVLRTKEDAQDYRFFPEPDLLTVCVPQERVRALKESIPELPHVRMKRFLEQYGFSTADALPLVENPDRADLLEETVSLGADAKAVCNWLNGEIARLLGEQNAAVSETKLTARELASVIAAIEGGEISHTAGKTVVEALMREGKTAAEIIEKLGLAQISDRGALKSTATDVIARNEKAADDYRGGKTNALGFLVGQCMRASKGKGNPALFREILTELLEGGN